MFTPRIPKEPLLNLIGAPVNDALEKPLGVIRDKSTPDGVWQLEKSLNGQMWVDVEVKGQPSKWITLFALIVLDHFDEVQKGIN